MASSYLRPLPAGDSSPLLDDENSIGAQFSLVSIPMPGWQHSALPGPAWCKCRGRPDRSGPASATHSNRAVPRSEEHTSELQSLRHLVCRLLLEKKKQRRGQDADENTYDDATDAGARNKRCYRGNIHMNSDNPKHPSPFLVMRILTTSPRRRFSS